METTAMTPAEKNAALVAAALKHDSELTPGSADFLLYLVRESANYTYLCDAPLFDISKESKGYLTHLKKLGYLTTRYESDCNTTFAYFHEKSRLLVEAIKA